MAPDSNSIDMADSIRFVVGSSDTFEQAARAIDNLFKAALPPGSIGIVAKQNVLSHDSKLLSRVDGNDIPRMEFDFLASHHDKIVCIGSTLGQMLRERARDGSSTLNEALHHWLLPRHAKSLSEVVEKDGILIWVEVHSLEEERAASLSLLRHSQGRVEVHDLDTTRQAKPLSVRLLKSVPTTRPP